LGSVPIRRNPNPNPNPNPNFGESGFGESGRYPVLSQLQTSETDRQTDRQTTTEMTNLGGGISVSGIELHRFPRVDRDRD